MDNILCVRGVLCLVKHLLCVFWGVVVVTRRFFARFEVAVFACFCWFVVFLVVLCVCFVLHMHVCFVCALF